MNRFGSLVAAWALAAGLAGCSGLSTAVVPAAEPTVQYDAPDTTVVQEVPPVDMGGEVTQPVSVTVYNDTTSRPTGEVESIEVDRTDPDNPTVSVRTRQDSTTVETRLRLQAVGERGVYTFDSTGALQGTVFGAPVDHEAEVRTSSIERPWHKRLWAQIRLGIAFVGGLVFGYLATKFSPL